MSIKERDWNKSRKEEGKHEPICGECLEPWPCTHERIEREASLFAERLRMMCHCCGEVIRAGQALEQFGGEAIDGSGVIGPKFHAAKSRYPICAVEAKYYKAKWQKVNAERRAS